MKLMDLKLTDSVFLRRLFFVLWIITVLSLYVALRYPYRGEEGVYTASSFEMLFNHDYLTTHFMGPVYGRPPLFNWLILAVAKVIGYKHMLIAARFVTITMVALTSAVTWWLAKELTNNKTVSVFAALCFLSGDVLFRRSWIAYADPTFSFFIISALVCFWVAYRKDNVWLLFPAVVAIAAAFLTKSITAYVFYGVTVLVLLCLYRKWKFVFNPVSLALHISALAFPVLWFMWTADSHSSARMTFDLLNKVVNYHYGIGHYFLGLLDKSWGYIFRYAPLSLIVLYSVIRRKVEPNTVITKKDIVALLLIVFINIFPYWAFPESWQIRYLSPIYPLIAVLFSYVLWNSGETIRKISILTIMACIALKVFISPWGLPWFEHMTYGWSNVAHYIVENTKEHPLYIADNDSLVGSLDAVLYPAPPVVNPPAGWRNGVLVGSYVKLPNMQSVKTLCIVGRRPIEIQCRGEACSVKWSAFNPK